ncbi:MAG: hypothetical protein R3E35_01330 [Rhodocyclaceae bacterium]
MLAQVGEQVASNACLGRGCDSEDSVALTALGWMGEDGEAGLHQRIDVRPDGRSMAMGERPAATRWRHQFGQAGGGVIDVESLMDGSLRVDDANSVVWLASPARRKVVMDNLP